MLKFVESAADAAVLLKNAERIMVIGCSGGGKSTLSHKLSEVLDLPYISMDREFFWLPGWVKRSKEEERQLIVEAVAGRRWLMDGTGPSTFDIRLPRAEAVVWVRMPRWLCLWGICKRAFRHLGKTRPDMAPGCLEQFPDREFLTYIWTFEKRFVPKILVEFEEHGPSVPIVQLSSRAEMSDLLQGVAPVA